MRLPFGHRLGPLGAGALLLAGCTAGPDYHVPEKAVVNAPSAKGPFVSAEKPVFSQGELPDRWWRLYRDPRLDGYVEEALRANADLRSADANLRIASALVREAEAGRTVQTSIDAGAVVARPGGPGARLPGEFDYSLGASIAYPLDLAGGIRRGIEAARDDREAVEAARDQVRVVIAAAVTRNYAAVCSANVSLAATRGILEIQLRTQDAVTRLYEGGRGTHFDVTRAMAETAASQALLPTIVAKRRSALFEIAALMGRPPADYPKELADCDALPQLAAPLPVGDGAALLKRRPDVRASERRLAAATATIGIETAQLYPQVTLGGTFGIANQFKFFATSESTGGSIGPLIHWAFPNRKLIHARIDAAGAGADAASAEFDGTVIRALTQTESGLTNYAQEIERDDALERERDAAAEATAEAQRLFLYGRTDLLSLLTAESRLATAQTTLANSKGELLDRQIEVFLALGGGWG